MIFPHVVLLYMDALFWSQMCCLVNVKLFGRRVSISYDYFVGGLLTRRQLLEYTYSTSQVSQHLNSDCDCIQGLQC